MNHLSSLRRKSGGGKHRPLTLPQPPATAVSVPSVPSGLAGEEKGDERGDHHFGMSQFLGWM